MCRPQAESNLWTKVVQTFQGAVAVQEGGAPRAAGIATAGHPSDRPNKFHTAKVPNISVQDYLDRIQRYTGCSESCFIVALVYIDRLVQRNHHIRLDSHTVHRFVSLLTS